MRRRRTIYFEDARHYYLYLPDPPITMEQAWMPVDQVSGTDAVMLAERFLRALPYRIPLPELAVEPDGSISLDWIRSRTRLFSVSVGRASRLAFAWLDGSDTGHGVARFDGQNVPPRILEGIEAVVVT